MVLKVNSYSLLFKILSFKDTIGYVRALQIELLA